MQGLTGKTTEEVISFFKNAQIEESTLSVALFKDKFVVKVDGREFVYPEPTVIVNLIMNLGGVGEGLIPMARLFHLLNNRRDLNVLGRIESKDGKQVYRYPADEYLLKTTVEIDGELHAIGTLSNTDLFWLGVGYDKALEAQSHSLNKKAIAEKTGSSNKDALTLAAALGEVHGISIDEMLTMTVGQILALSKGAEIRNKK